MRSGRLRPQQGFTLLAVLAAMFLLALGTQGVMVYVSQQAQREREAELLRVGKAYVEAIGAYYESSPGGVKRWPRRMEDLLDDPRFVGIRRHLREAYRDPIAHDKEWELIEAPDGGIAGVRSRSQGEPLRSAAVDLGGGLRLAAARHYADWEFVYRPAATAPVAPGAR